MVGWFEIPVNDMSRAIKFYEEVFDVKTSRNPMGEFDMAFFPWIEDGQGSPGALVKHNNHYETSNHAGVLIYFLSDDITTELNKVEKAGGKILQPKTLIAAQIGYMAMFEDSEGNRIALYAKANETKQ
jgi:uncharacterized protein